MGAGIKPTLVEEVPEMCIRGGNFHFWNEDSGYAFPLSVARALVRRADAVIAMYDAKPSNVAQIKCQRSKPGAH